MQRIVVLRSDAPLDFVADACRALAAAVNQVRAPRPSDAELVDVYAEFVVAYARLVQSGLADRPDANIFDGIIDPLRRRGFTSASG